MILPLFSTSTGPLLDPAAAQFSGLSMKTRSGGLPGARDATRSSAPLPISR